MEAHAQPHGIWKQLGDKEGGIPLGLEAKVFVYP